MANEDKFPPRCGIVLAGGEGKRLQGLVLQLKGKKLPKQYVNFIGPRSMLEHTFHRAEKLIPPTRLFTVVSRDHLGHREVRRQLFSRPSGTVVVQPENKDTGPGLLLPLMHLHKRYPGSTVAVFPSDHFILEEDLFMAYVDLAFQAVDSDPFRIVLLAIKPNRLEPEYGYILPGEKINDQGIYRVRLFIEKPEPQDVGRLVRQGGLWNTMVMVFRTKTLLDLARLVVPRIHSSFQPIWKSIGTPSERLVVEESYRCMEAANLSKGLLEILPSQHRSSLSLLPVSGVFWDDWGTAHRITNVLQAIKLPGVPGRRALRDLRRIDAALSIREVFL